MEEEEREMKRSSCLNGPMIWCGATILVLMVLHTMAYPLSEEFSAKPFAVSGSESSFFNHHSRTKRSKDIDDHLVSNFFQSFFFLKSFVYFLPSCQNHNLLEWKEGS